MDYAKLQKMNVRHSPWFYAQYWEDEVGCKVEGMESYDVKYGPADFVIAYPDDQVPVVVEVNNLMLIQSRYDLRDRVVQQLKEGIVQV